MKAGTDAVTYGADEVMAATLAYMLLPQMQSFATLV
jgi:hypothetical protein